MASLWLTLAVRCLLVGLFLPFSALDKILNFEAAVDQAAQACARARWRRADPGRICDRGADVTGGTDRHRSTAWQRCILAGLLHDDGAAVEAVLARAGLPPEGRQPRPRGVLGFPARTARWPEAFCCWPSAAMRAGRERFWQHPLASTSSLCGHRAASSGTECARDRAIRRRSCATGICGPMPRASVTRAHVRIEEFELQSMQPPAAPQWQGRRTSGAMTTLVTVQPVGWIGEWHENPKPQWIVPLSGRWFVESMDGTRVEMGAGRDFLRRRSALPASGGPAWVTARGRWAVRRRC